MEDKITELSDELLEKISGGIIVRDGDKFWVFSDDGEEPSVPMLSEDAADWYADVLHRSKEVMTRDEFVAKYGDKKIFHWFD